MRDFIRVFLMLIIVFGGMAFSVYLGWILGTWGMALLSLIITVAIIVLFIKYSPAGK